MKRMINFKPAPAFNLMLGLLPFVLLVVLYIVGSDARLEINPNDKLLPSFEQIGTAIDRMAFEPNKRSGDYLLWVDTASSLTRLSLGVLIAAVLGLMIGLMTGALPLIAAGLSPLLTVTSLIPPLALLPVLFIVFGLGELSKVALIAIGITPFIARDIQRRTLEIPHEQLVKAQTLGANTAGWLFLIAAEAIAATDGLGYRIFLVRRYMSMDVILPYVAWITLLAFMFDQLLAWLNTRLYPWDVHGGRS
jgi:NitT/TauT family transport system permease protein